MKKYDTMKIETENSILKAERLAMNYLSYKSRTEKEVYDKLRSYGEFDEEDIAQVIDSLKDVGYINDKKYAEQFARSKALNKLDGTQKIKSMLLQRGIGSKIADEAIEALNDPYGYGEFDEVANAVKLIEKKVGRRRLDYTEKRKIFNYLCGKGYSFGTINKAFKCIDDEDETGWE